MIKIFIVSHKEFLSPDIPYHYPIYVGGRIKSGLTDDTGDNIADKNPLYNELTALYWLWKNTEIPDYIGLSHYRRYFNFNGKCNKYSRLGLAGYKKSLNKKYGWDEKSIENAVNGSDIIVAREITRIDPHEDSIYSNMMKNDPRKTLLTLRECVSELYPEYIETYDEHLTRKSISSFNMFIMKKELFEEYAEWLFNVLFRFEEKWSAMYGYENIPRACGFMGEHLLHVFITYKESKGVKVVRRQTIMFYETDPEPGLKKRAVAFVKQCFTKIAPYNSTFRDKVLYKFFYKW